MAKFDKPPMTIPKKTPEEVEQQAIQEEMERAGSSAKHDDALKPIPDEFKGSTRNRKAASYRFTDQTLNLVDLLHRLERADVDVSSPRKKEGIAEDALLAYLKKSLKKYGYDTSSID